jgi:hypothetical protein
MVEFKMPTALSESTPIPEIPTRSYPVRLPHESDGDEGRYR